MTRAELCARLSGRTIMVFTTFLNFTMTVMDGSPSGNLLERDTDNSVIIPQDAVIEQTSGEYDEVVYVIMDANENILYWISEYT